MEIEEPIFVDGLILAINKSKKNKIDLTNEGLRVYYITTYKNKEKAICDINDYSKTLSRIQRETMLNKIFSQLQIDKNDIMKEFLTWDEIIEMCDKGVTIGAHTLSHPYLTNLNIDEAKYEITESKKILENKLKRKIEFFAYPYGGNDSYNDKIIKIVKKAGFICAFSLHRSNRLKNEFAIGRINIDLSKSSLTNYKFSKSLFAMEVSGMADIIFLRFIKRKYFKSNKKLQGRCSQKFGQCVKL
jgi:hypothetical protein